MTLDYIRRAIRDTLTHSNSAAPPLQAKLIWRVDTDYERGPQEDPSAISLSTLWQRLIVGFECRDQSRRAFVRACAQPRRLTFGLDHGFQNFDGYYYCVDMNLRAPDPDHKQTPSTEDFAVKANRQSSLTGEARLRVILPGGEKPQVWMLNKVYWSDMVDGIPRPLLDIRAVLKGQGYDVPFARYFTLRFPTAAGVPLPSAPNRTTHDKASRSLIKAPLIPSVSNTPPIPFGSLFHDDNIEIIGICLDSFCYGIINYHKLSCLRGPRGGPRQIPITVRPFCKGGCHDFCLACREQIECVSVEDVELFHRATGRSVAVRYVYISKTTS